MSSPQNTIKKVRGREILDSRGEYTIEAEVTTEGGVCVRASVPQGKSRGTHEAIAVPASEGVFAIENEIEKVLCGEDVVQQGRIDDRLISLDGTEGRGRLGGNTILAVSLACARAGARVMNMPLWKYIRRLHGKPLGEAPHLFVNLINGGLHAGNNLLFQEYLLIPKTRDVQKAITLSVSFYHALGDELTENLGRSAVLVGDEGGFAPVVDDAYGPLYFMKRVAEKMGILNEVSFGIDAAASNVDWSEEKLTSCYKKMLAEYPLSYLEDPYRENDFEAFAKLTEEASDDITIAGDDLTVTNVERIKKAYDHDSVNGVIVKPNQIGTLTETLQAVALAQDYGWRIVVSHRSGETNDDAIADIARGVSAHGFKLGAPARGERIAKYNRLLEIADRERDF